MSERNYFQLSEEDLTEQRPDERQTASTAPSGPTRIPFAMTSDQFQEVSFDASAPGSADSSRRDVGRAESSDGYLKTNTNRPQPPSPQLGRTLQPLDDERTSFEDQMTNRPRREIVEEKPTFGFYSSRDMVEGFETREMQENWLTDILVCFAFNMIYIAILSIIGIFSSDEGWLTTDAYPLNIVDLKGYPSSITVGWNSFSFSDDSWGHCDECGAPGLGTVIFLMLIPISVCSVLVAYSFKFRFRVREGAILGIAVSAGMLVAAILYIINLVSTFDDSKQFKFGTVANKT
eukprot:Nk52_evm1s2080 gene=Nk52_evmTU1s2080